VGPATRSAFARCSATPIAPAVTSPVTTDYRSISGVTQISLSEQLSALENRLLAPITSAGSAGSGGSSPTTGNLGFLDVTGETVLHKNVIADNINGDQGQERIRFSETGGLNMHTWLGAAMHFDLTNINNSAKRGLTMDVRSTKNSPLANVGGIAISQYSLPDTGGDTSAIWLGQSGGGNALSVFNLSALTPPRLPKVS